jgi:imidazolonepropionase-like amidohydrolase
VIPLLAAARVAIVGATLVGSGPEPSVVKDGIVLASAGRITAVGERAFVPLPKGVTLVDGRGLWLVAGREDDLRAVGDASSGPLTAPELVRRLGTAARAAGREPASLVTGRPADLVLLEADPLADGRNLRRVRRVLRAEERP